MITSHILKLLVGMEQMFTPYLTNVERVRWFCSISCWIILISSVFNGKVAERKLCNIRDILSGFTDLVSKIDNPVLIVKEPASCFYIDLR
jgi:hypothetical protein